jgi:hypothetical protein
MTQWRPDTSLQLTFEFFKISKPIRTKRWKWLKQSKQLYTQLQENNILATSPKEMWAHQQAKNERCWAIIRINEFLTRQGRSSKESGDCPPLLLTPFHTQDLLPGKRSKVTYVLHISLPTFKKKKETKMLAGAPKFKQSNYHQWDTDDRLYSRKPSLTQQQLYTHSSTCYNWADDREQ